MYWKFMHNVLNQYSVTLNEINEYANCVGADKNCCLTVNSNWKILPNSFIYESKFAMKRIECSMLMHYTALWETTVNSMSVK